MGLTDIKVTVETRNEENSINSIIGGTPLSDCNAQLKAANAKGIENLSKKGVKIGSNSSTDDIMNAIEKIEYTDNFWDSFQNNGERTDYNYAFYGSGWTSENFKPKYDLVVSSCSYMFAYSFLNGLNLKETLIDLGLKLDTSNTNAISNMFISTGITVIPTIDCSGKSTESAFVSKNILEIEKIIVNEKTSFSNTFMGANNLSKLTVEGNISKLGFNVQWSTLLSHDSLISILNALADKTGVAGTWTVTFGSTNKAKLTEEELSIAYSKNWSVI